MSLRIGDLAPDFTAQSTEGDIRFHQWLGGDWGLFFSHPQDYTPVCTTELGVVAQLKAEFKKRGVKAIAISVDSLDRHKGWVKDIEETMATTIDYPIVADIDASVARAYGMIHENSNDLFTIRSVFVIGPDRRIRLTLSYPVAVGRNFDEILRVIDALQLSERHNVYTPANWQNGGDVIIKPGATKEQLDKEFPEHLEVRSYLRYTRQPK